MRLRALTTSIEEALADRIGDVGPHDWRYGVTLLYIAHRETRLARRPRDLGDEDQGRAHGMWQIWSWKKMNPFAPATALDMLIENPGAWSLGPRSTPWVGYPECARFIETNPFE